MKRTTYLALGLVMAAALTVAGLAAAGVTGAHFVGTPSVTVSGTQLTASGKVAGLGAVEQIHVTVSADVQCINPGSNKPKAGNKTSVGAGGDFPVQNGKAEFSLVATANFQPTCSGPMSLEWTNVIITVTAPGVFLQAGPFGPFTTSGS